MYSHLKKWPAGSAELVFDQYSQPNLGLEL